jgi:hypothetical protein
MLFRVLEAVPYESAIQEYAFYTKYFNCNSYADLVYRFLCKINKNAVDVYQ